MNEQETSKVAFTIGDLANQLDVTTRTIRYYEQRGLLKPDRSNGGQRIYTRRDRGRLKLILRAKLAGFDLDESKEVLDLYDILPSDKVELAQAKKLTELVGRRIAELDFKLTEMTNMRDELQTYLDTLQEKSHGTD